MSALQKIDEQTSQRDLRARKILATARANLVGHLARDDRVAVALKTARENIIKFDPKRLASIRALAPTREQEVAARLRKERVARTLRDARDTVSRLADMQAPSRRPAQTVYKTKTDASRPGAPSSPSSPAPVARGAAPQDEATNYFEVCREAIVEFVLETIDQERARWQREIDGLRCEVDGLVRELDLVHRPLRH